MYSISGSFILSTRNWTLIWKKKRKWKEMPPPRNPKEIKQIPVIVGYYCKYISYFEDTARPLECLTWKFHLTGLCSIRGFKCWKGALVRNLFYGILILRNSTCYLLMLLYRLGHVYSHSPMNIQLMRRNLKSLIPSHMTGLLCDSQLSLAAWQKKSTLYMCLPKS